MKLFLLLFVLSGSAAFANSVTEMNQALLQDVKRDIQKDEDKFRSRSPASVKEVDRKKEPTPKGPDKIEKNVKQLGHSEW